MYKFEVKYQCVIAIICKPALDNFYHHKHDKLLWFLLKKINVMTIMSGNSIDLLIKLDLFIHFTQNAV